MDKIQQEKNAITHEIESLLERIIKNDSEIKKMQGTSFIILLIDRKESLQIALNKLHEKMKFIDEMQHMPCCSACDGRGYFYVNGGSGEYKSNCLLCFGWGKIEEKVKLRPYTV